VLQSLAYSENFAGDVDVIIRAVWASGSSFDRWSWSTLTSTFNPITLPMPAHNAVVYAHLNSSYMLSLIKEGIGSGQAIANSGPDLLPVVLAIDIGTTVTLEAVPDDTSLFSSWSGDLKGSANPTNIAMDGNKSEQANFKQCDGLPYSQEGFSHPVKINNDNDHVHQYNKLQLDMTFFSFFCQKNSIRIHITWAPEGLADA
jgi:hypothetical protein